MEDRVLNTANKTDSRFLWELRNHPEVRKWSFNSDEIPWEDHEKWFSRFLETPGHIFYLIQQNNENLGYVRFSKDDSRIVIDVAVKPGVQSKGLGSWGLKNGSLKYIEEFAVQSVYAEIKLSNTPSIKSFSKAGFSQIDKNPEFVIMEFRKNES